MKFNETVFINTENKFLILYNLNNDTLYCTQQDYKLLHILGGSGGYIFIIENDTGHPVECGHLIGGGWPSCGVLTSDFC